MIKSLLIAFLSLPTLVLAQGDGNTSIKSFNKAKRLLLSEVYAKPGDRRTIYCDAVFDGKKNVTLPEGFTTTRYKNRLARYETEHVVPAENFGRTFSEWRDGHPQCVNNKGKPFKGRKCAEKVNTEYRYMQSDMFNLYPAIGSVNAARQNYNFVMLPDSSSGFGSCDMQIEGRKAQPPVGARGEIARTYLYMESAYPRYSMSKSQRQLMNAWDNQYPVTAFECHRASVIEQVQGSYNTIMRQRCAQR